MCPHKRIRTARPIISVCALYEGISLVFKPPLMSCVCWVGWTSFIATRFCNSYQSQD